MDHGSSLSPPDDPDRQSPRVPRSLRNVSERFVAGNRLTLLRSGAEAYEAMLGDIARAEHQVLLEMYWFGSDHIGWRFARALLLAAERGVETRVIYDAIGSLDTDPALFDELRAGGVEVVEFNPILPWRTRFRWASVSRRDHRKILTVDGFVGYTGGINIAAEWCPEDPTVEAWRDDMVRVEGPAVADFVHLFERTWQREGGEEPSAAHARAPDRGEAARRSGETEGRPGQAVSVLGKGFFRGQRQIARAYLANIWRAERRIWISNSYFVPDRTVIQALVQAARRGVDVRVLLPGEIDVKVVRYASQAVWGRLLRAGVRIYRWTGNVLHAKTAVIDSSWCTIGTFNLDHLSLTMNLEVNLSVRDEAFGEVMDESFRTDLERAQEVTLREFSFRPLGERLLEWFLYRFRKFM